VFAVIIVVGPATGAAINPARYLGAVFMMGAFGGHVLWSQVPAYLIGELAGGVLGGLAWVGIGRVREDAAMAEAAQAHAYFYMFNAGQQVGGSLGLAIIGTVAWTVVNNRLRSPAHPGYAHALSSGVTSAMEIGACAGLLVLVITLVAIRVRREDLPDGPVVM